MKNRGWKSLVLILIMTFVLSSTAAGTEAPDENELYARSAVLMDGSSGRILFGKNETEVLPMASTTKIMTCILALECAEKDEVVRISSNASMQPKVRLGLKEGETYCLEDLLYSLMLESHNDSAVAIAEHIGGSVENFVLLMNKKAKELGCSSTHYVTVNGLDAKDEYGEHATTAEDLATVMSYCVLRSPKQQEFLKITQKRTYQFQNLEGTRTFFCQNHNAFLDMLEGAISGKTGFTSKAGYCYVGAVQKNDSTFVIALLACGWPYNRTYKWSDSLRLMKYGIEEFEKREIPYQKIEKKIVVEKGINGEDPWKQAMVMVGADYSKREKKQYLLRKDEVIKGEIILKKQIQAPVKKGIQIGKICYQLGGVVLEEYPIITMEAVSRENYTDWLRWSIRQLFMQK